MNTEEIIKACKSGKWSAEHIVMDSGYGVKDLAAYFNLDSSIPRKKLKRQIVNEINKLIENG